MVRQQELSTANLQLERQAGDQEMAAKNLQTDLDTAAKVKAALEEQVKAAEDQCSIWRAKVRHRHRALEMPSFEKSKSGQAKKEKWLEERALAESLGFDADNSKEVTIAFDAPPPLGLGLLNCKDHSGQTFTVIHSIKEVRRL